MSVSERNPVDDMLHDAAESAPGATEAAVLRYLRENPDVLRSAVKEADLQSLADLVAAEPQLASRTFGNMAEALVSFGRAAEAMAAAFRGGR